MVIRNEKQTIMSTGINSFFETVEQYIEQRNAVQEVHREDD
jgi:hypothetical protein